MPWSNIHMQLLLTFSKILYSPLFLVIKISSVLYDADWTRVWSRCFEAVGIKCRLYWGCYDWTADLASNVRNLSQASGHPPLFAVQPAWLEGRDGHELPDSIIIYCLSSISCCILFCSTFALHLNSADLISWKESPCDGLFLEQQQTSIVLSSSSTLTNINLHF